MTWNKYFSLLIFNALSTARIQSEYWTKIDISVATPITIVLVPLQFARIYYANTQTLNLLQCDLSNSWNLREEKKILRYLSTNSRFKICFPYSKA